MATYKELPNILNYLEQRIISARLTMAQNLRFGGYDDYDAPNGPSDQWVLQDRIYQETDATGVSETTRLAYSYSATLQEKGLDATDAEIQSAVDGILSILIKNENKRNPYVVVSRSQPG